jgi:hypothetical protein
MGTRNYRTVAAAVLAGAIMFSPLLCGMTCLAGRESKHRVAGDFGGDLVESGVVGCVVANMVGRFNAGDWEDVLQVGAWIETGIQAMKLVHGFENIAGEISWP